jgi:hypothetical protein
LAVALSVLDVSCWAKRKEEDSRTKSKQFFMNVPSTPRAIDYQAIAV